MKFKIGDKVQYKYAYGHQLELAESAEPNPANSNKNYPMYSGLLKYFPDALREVSYTSKVANDQHNPGEPLHWAREKSTDHLDACLRHLQEYSKGNKNDTDGTKHWYNFCNELSDYYDEVVGDLENEILEIESANTELEERIKKLQDENNHS